MIPTLAADSALVDCVRSLDAQTYRDFEIIVVDNSGQNRVEQMAFTNSAVRVIANAANAGFGAAINQGYRASSSEFIATLNDDAVACPEWLAQMVEAVRPSDDIGMVASQVRLGSGEALDSAGMLISADGSSRQRGHGECPERYRQFEEVLLPSGSAALYRREMLDDVGAFDGGFFLYCEDTDVGLRARWAGWRCVYQPCAVVLHRYSHSAGRASALKAYFVERNRLSVIVKNFPVQAVAAAPFATAVRYFWHVRFMVNGRGAAAEFQKTGSGLSLVWFVVKAHLALIARLPRLLAERRKIRKHARLSSAQFMTLLRRHRISAKEVAAL